jgi:DNA-binding transcriptional LysR family regulator
VRRAQEQPWPGLQVRHLAALRAVTDEGSLHGATRRLGYSQSAVSQQIASLERIVGDQLLTRAQPVTATQAGRILLGESDAVLARLRAAHARLHALAAGRSDVIRVGLYWGVAGFFLSHVLDELSETAPHADLRFTAGPSSTTLQQSAARRF